MSGVGESTFADAINHDKTDDTPPSVATPSTVNQDATDDTAPSAEDGHTTDDTAPSAEDGHTMGDTTLSTIALDTTNDTAVAGQTCRKCNKFKAPAEFISDKTGRPTVKCRMCLAPNPKTVRDSPGKRKVPVSRKAADNTKIHEELEGRCVSNKVKTGERKVAEQNSAAAREMIQKSFGRATK